MAEEDGFTVDLEEFHSCMDKQRVQSRRENKFMEGISPWEGVDPQESLAGFKGRFLGYETLGAQSRVGPVECVSKLSKLSCGSGFACRVRFRCSLPRLRGGQIFTELPFRSRGLLLRSSAFGRLALGLHAVLWGDGRLVECRVRQLGLGSCYADLHCQPRGEEQLLHAVRPRASHRRRRPN